VEVLVDDLGAARPVEPADDPGRTTVRRSSGSPTMIVEFAAEGGRFEEAPLPTLP
jgi:hypothetical protein